MQLSRLKVIVTNYNRSTTFTYESCALAALQTTTARALPVAVRVSVPRRVPPFKHEILATRLRHAPNTFTLESPPLCRGSTTAFKRESAVLASRLNSESQTPLVLPLMLSRLKAARSGSCRAMFLGRGCGRSVATTFRHETSMPGGSFEWLISSLKVIYGSWPG